MGEFGSVKQAHNVYSGLQAETFIPKSCGGLFISSYYINRLN